MRVVITGAGGFIGRKLVGRLLKEPQILGDRIQELVLLDVRADHLPASNTSVETACRQVEGDLTDPRVIDDTIRGAVDCVFHLASVPGGAAEADYDVGRRANVDGTFILLDSLRSLKKPCTFVFASSVAVFGAAHSEQMDEDTYPAPTMSYGAQKWIGEILVGDYSRRGWIDGRAVRLPGIVARPPQKTGQLSAFLSDLLRELAAGREFICPVAADAQSWWMSAQCCIDNLVHAALIPVEQSAIRRTWTLPVLHSSFAEVVDAIAQSYGGQVLDRVRYEPDARLEALFGRFPELHTPRAIAAGFRHDGDLGALVVRSLE